MRICENECFEDKVRLPKATETETEIEIEGEGAEGWGERGINKRRRHWSSTMQQRSPLVAGTISVFWLLTLIFNLLNVSPTQSFPLASYLTPVLSIQPCTPFLPALAPTISDEWLSKSGGRIPVPPDIVPTLLFAEAMAKHCVWYVHPGTVVSCASRARMF